MKPKRIIRLIPSIVCVILCFLAHHVLAQVNELLPKPNQKSLTLSSQILQEQRPIWIHLPTGYEGSSNAYPVLYLLDGGSHFGYVVEMMEFLSNPEKARMPSMIIVAIHNTNRTLDFTPTASPSIGGNAAKTGGATKFLQFIKQELVPFIDKTYRTQPYRILEGHSLGGLFALFAKESAPDLFQSMVLISPALFDEFNSILTDFSPFLRRNSNLSGSLYLSIGNENTQKVDSLTRQLNGLAPPSLRWAYRQYKDEDHFSVTFKSMYDGLRFIYADWFVDGTTLTSYADLEAHFARLSKEYHYVIKPDESLVNNWGYQKLRSGHIDTAVEFFRQNVKNHPRSSNAYDSLGEAYLLKGETKLAIESYEKSVFLDPANASGQAALKKLKEAKN